MYASNKTPPITPVRLDAKSKVMMSSTIPILRMVAGEIPIAFAPSITSFVPAIFPTALKINNADTKIVRIKEMVVFVLIVMICYLINGLAQAFKLTFILKTILELILFLGRNKNKFINMKKLTVMLNKASIVFSTTLLSVTAINAQTSVFDIIAASPNHTYLEAAIVQEGLVSTLDDNNASFTVFAPDDNAFTAIATSLGTTINGLLALPNLTDILTYHVLGTEVNSSAITNGAIVQPLSTTNSLKLTLKTNGDVYVNQAKVSTANISADNGILHIIDAVVLPVETVVDLAIDNGFSTLAAAAVKAELLPSLTDPFATLTVFAPTNAAFDDLAEELDVSVSDLLDLPNLADLLTYHVLGTEVGSNAITNGAIVQPLSTTNSLKLTLKSNGNVFVNHAQVTNADILADNGVVHVLNKVVLPIETVVDIAIDNGFTSLTAAVIKAELLPTLLNPFSEFTVFAPTNDAFQNLATLLNTDLTGLLGNPNLSDILTYHVLSDDVYSTDLVNNSSVATVNGQSIQITTIPSVKINNSNVTLADIESDNGIVHVIDAVLLPSLAELIAYSNLDIRTYPNPCTETISLDNELVGDYTILNNLGQHILSGNIENACISVSEIENGNYILLVKTNTGTFQGKFVKQ